MEIFNTIMNAVRFVVIILLTFGIFVTVYQADMENMLFEVGFVMLVIGLFAYDDMRIKQLKKTLDKFNNE